MKKVLGGDAEEISPPGESMARRSTLRLQSRDSRSESLQRTSNGLSHFFQAIPRVEGLSFLDLGGISESNVNFLSQLGCRIHAVDLLANFDRWKKELPGRQFDVESAREFVAEYLDFDQNQFDAVLVWDVLEFLDTDVLYLTVPRLGQVMRPGGGLLTFFHTQSRGQTVQVYRYQIDDAKTLRLKPKQLRVLPHTFNNRSLERLFGEFASVKFFLTRDNLREVIIAR